MLQFYSWENKGKQILDGTLDFVTNTVGWAMKFDEVSINFVNFKLQH